MAVAHDKHKKTLLKHLLREYVRLLHERPVITKSCTSAGLGALGCLISQFNTGDSASQIQWRSVLSYAAVGLIFTGPSVHYFHAWLEHNFPKGSRNAAVKKLLLDRTLFCPSYLLLYLYLLALFEANLVGHDWNSIVAKIAAAYRPALLVNWKLWTPLQYMNVKYIPQQYRSPFMSIMALLWTVYIAVKRK